MKKNSVVLTNNTKKSWTFLSFLGPAQPFLDGFYKNEALAWTTLVKDYNAYVSSLINVTIISY